GGAPPADGRLVPARGVAPGARAARRRGGGRGAARAACALRRARGPCRRTGSGCPRRPRAPRLRLPACARGRCAAGGANGARDRCRAVRAAHRLESERRLRLEVRVGVHTGLVVVRELRHATYQGLYDLVGLTPQTAARLDELAEPGEVLVSG